MDFVGDQPSANDDFVTPEKRGAPNAPEKSVKKQRFSAVGHRLRTYWYVVVVVVVVLGVGAVYIGMQRSTSAKWEKAEDYFARADYEKAADQLSSVSMPSDTTKLDIYSKTMHATASAHTDRYEKALKAYQKLYEQKKDPQTKIMMANIYNQQQKYDQAQKMLNEVIAANPTYTQAYINLAMIYRLQGKQADAVAIAKKGIEANKNNVSLNELLVSLLLEQKDSQDYKDAVANLSAVNPNSELLKTLQ